MYICIMGKKLKQRGDWMEGAQEGTEAGAVYEAGAVLHKHEGVVSSLLCVWNKEVLEGEGHFVRHLKWDTEKMYKTQAKVGIYYLLNIL